MSATKYVTLTLCQQILTIKKNVFKFVVFCHADPQLLQFQLHFYNKTVKFPLMALLQRSIWQKLWYISSNIILVAMGSSIVSLHCPLSHCTPETNAHRSTVSYNNWFAYELTFKTLSGDERYTWPSDERHTIINKWRRIGQCSTLQTWSAGGLF